MAVFFTVTFTVSLVGIVALFALRMWEERQGGRIAPDVRERADAGARIVRTQLLSGVYVLEHLPSFTAAFARWSIHTIAVLTARIARFAERAAHRVADKVAGREQSSSHTRRDEKPDNLDTNH